MCHCTRVCLLLVSCQGVLVRGGCRKKAAFARLGYPAAPDPSKGTALAVFPQEVSTSTPDDCLIVTKDLCCNTLKAVMAK